MAVVTFNRADFEGLVGKKLTDKDYKEVLPMMGTPLEELTAKEVTFEVFPNRPDLLAVEGFARAVQGFLGIKTGLVNYKINKSNYSATIAKSMLGVRGCAAFAVVKNVKFTDESIVAFMQLQEKLALTIGRRRKKASIGAYDLRDIKFPVKLVTKPSTFKFRALGFSKERAIKQLLEEHPRGQEYGHLLKGWTSYPVYLDANDNVLSLLPLTNAEFSKISKNTTDVLVEVTGTEWNAVFEMLNIVVAALTERGASVYEVTTNYPKKKVSSPNLKPWAMKLDPKYVNTLLDLDLKPEEIKRELEKMRFGVSGNNVFIPQYRTDVMHSIDLVEDIAIAHGYPKFEPHIPKIATIGQPNPKEEFYDLLRPILVGLGFNETLTFVLSSKDKEHNKALFPSQNRVEIQNPKTEEYTSARTSLIPGLLETFAVNASSEMPHRVFEIGDVIHVDAKAETGAVNIPKLAAGISHTDASFAEIKAIVEAFFTQAGKKITFETVKHPTFIEGRTAEVMLNKKPVAIFGEVSPQALHNFGIEYPAAVVEVELSTLND